MRMESARKRACEANVLALAAQKEREAAELELAELERLVDPKKQRTDDEEAATHKAVDDWDLKRPSACWGGGNGGAGWEIRD